MLMPVRLSNLSGWAVRRGPRAGEDRRVTTRTLICASLMALAAASPAYGAESWHQPVTFGEPLTANDQAMIATNSPGVAAVVWNEFLGTRTPRFAVRAATRTVDGTWSAAEQLSGAGEASGPVVGVDPQGRITAVWSEADKIMWADKAPGSGWTAGQQIPGATGGNPDLFVASDGTATAVWQSGPGGSLVIKTSRRPLGGAWSSIESLSTGGSSFRAHIEGDIAGDISVSYTRDFTNVVAVDRPNSGPWGTPVTIAGPTLSDNVSDLVVAPNSGAATVFWQNGTFSAPLTARTRAASGWAAGANVPISGNTAGRLDLSERDRAAVDGQGLVTATWIADRKVLTAYQSNGAWTAPLTPAAIDPGDGTTALENLAIASNLFGRAVTVWQAAGKENRFSLRGPGPGAPWSSPKPVDGVPAEASALDVAVDDTGRVAYVWEAETGTNVSQLSISTYGAAAAAPEPPAQPGPAPSPPPSVGSSASKPLAAKVSGKASRARGVTFTVTSPAAGTATITIYRAKARKALGSVKAKLRAGANTVRVKRIKNKRFTKGSYRATITSKIPGTKTLHIPFKVAQRPRSP
jgi:hypothetical protein